MTPFKCIQKPAIAPHTCLVKKMRNIRKLGKYFSTNGTPKKPSIQNNFIKVYKCHRYKNILFKTSVQFNPIQSTVCQMFWSEDIIVAYMRSCLCQKKYTVRIRCCKNLQKRESWKKVFLSVRMHHGYLLTDKSQNFAQLFIRNDTILPPVLKKAREKIKERKIWCSKGKKLIHQTMLIHRTTTNSNIRVFACSKGIYFDLEIRVNF